MVDEVLRGIDLPIYQLNKQDGKIILNTVLFLFLFLRLFLGCWGFAGGKTKRKTMESEGSFFNPLCLGIPFDNVN